MIDKSKNMKLKYCKLLVYCAFVFANAPSFAQTIKNNLSISKVKAGDAFPLFTKNISPSFSYDTNDAKVVEIAAEAFANDINLICGKIMKINKSANDNNGYNITAGTIGHSKNIDNLIKTKQLDVTSIKNKWECFLIKVIDNKLIIAGSDPRGTAFGIFHLSKLMGVSPLVYWADVVPANKEALFISGSYISKEPSVKYRGIFINDEDWGLRPWAAKTLEPETGNIGPKTYAKVFELLLRLNANLIWPAMHPGTVPFFAIPANEKVAADYSIIVGSSHAEPMLRNNVGEWNEKTMGDFNYLTNRDAIDKYWESRVKESKRVDAIYTIGMRGVHDSQMEGVTSDSEAVPLLENIFKDQRGLLSKYVNKDVTSIPQVFVAYKEVLDFYDHGLKVPDDVTLVWPDDNYGYIRRLDNEKERRRSGGSGIYYHASYWGRPHDYLWLASANPALMQEEMMKAFNNGSKRLWILNVGDIKPIEYNIKMFLDMAYDTKPFEKNDYAETYMQQWLISLFGKNNGLAIDPVLNEYFQLAYERRPEFMGWSQVEPITQINHTAFNEFYYGDEAQKRMDRYQAIVNKVKSIRPEISPKDANAFYELIYYPVVCAALINKKFLYRDKSFFYSKQNRLSAVDYELKSKAAYDSIIAETDYYNNQLSAAKWKNMMSMQPRELPVFDKPEFPAITIDRSAGWSIAPEGFVTSDSSLVKSSNEYQLPSFDNLNRQKYFIDIFLTDSIKTEWTASGSAPWIQFSSSHGNFDADAGKNQERLYVSVDWSKAPASKTFNGQIQFTDGKKQLTVTITATHLSTNNFAGFIENNDYVSMYAVHYTRLKNNSYGNWKPLQGLGYTGSVLQLQTPQQKKIINSDDRSWISQNSSYAAYDFYTFSPADAALTVFTVPTHPLNNEYGMRYAVSVDDRPLQVVDFKTIGRSDEWKQNVLRNRAEKKVSIPSLGKGKHELRIYAIDPGVMLDGMLIDLGGLKNAYGAIDETISVKK